MALRRHLPSACTYHPADLYQWTSDVRQVDIDKRIFPEGAFDYVVLLGVLEYLAKPQLAFHFAKCCASAMVISYCYPITPDIRTRELSGWVNAFSPDELRYFAQENGWKITQSETFRRSAQTHQMLHVFAST